MPAAGLLAFEADVKYEAPIAFLPKRKLGESVARFRYVGNGFHALRRARISQREDRVAHAAV